MAHKNFSVIIIIIIIDANYLLHYLQSQTQIQVPDDVGKLARKNLSKSNPHSRNFTVIFCIPSTCKDAAAHHYKLVEHTSPPILPHCITACNDDEVCTFNNQ